MILDEMKKEHARQVRRGSLSYPAVAWENGTPSHWLQFAQDCGAVLPVLVSVQQTRAAARSADPVAVVAAIRRAAQAAGWKGSTRDGVICEALSNEACPATVRAFAARYWNLHGRRKPQQAPSILVRCEERAVVHVAAWGRDRSEVVLACQSTPVRWAARWEGEHAAGVEVTCKRCRRRLSSGRCARPQ